MSSFYKACDIVCCIVTFFLQDLVFEIPSLYFIFLEKIFSVKCFLKLI